MSEPRFKCGDRVTGHGYPGAYIGITPRDGRAVVDFDDAGLMYFPEDELELIPDTVLVTVELPRDEAESLCEIQERANVKRTPVEFHLPFMRAYSRLRVAVVEALRSIETPEGS